MNVRDAIITRKSVRAFRPYPVPEKMIRDILDVASRAPSGGNLQPWRVYVLAGSVRQALIDAVAAKLSDHPEGMDTEYPVYPPDLKDPYRSRRRKVGQDMYSLLGVLRSDRAGKIRHMARNYSFFDAPVGMMFTIDRVMGVGQFADLGMFMENIMLLARERGLHTCAQEAWARWHRIVYDVVGIPGHEMLFSGLALGYADEDAPVNRLETERATVDEFAEFLGFDDGQH